MKLSLPYTLMSFPSVQHVHIDSFFGEISFWGLLTKGEKFVDQSKKQGARNAKYLGMPELTKGEKNKKQLEASRLTKEDKLLHGSSKGESGNGERGSNNKGGLNGKIMHPSKEVRPMAIYNWYHL